MAVVGVHIQGYPAFKTTAALFDKASRYFSLADMSQIKAFCIVNDIHYPKEDISRIAMLVLICQETNGIWNRIPGKKQAAKIISDVERMSDQRAFNEGSGQ